MNLRLVLFHWFSESLGIRVLKFSLAVFIPLSTCFSTPAKAQSEIKSITPGKLIQSVECLGDRTQSYALYLPSYYTSERKWPILFAFDPAARGNIPVEHHQDAAEKYGWIVVGSNNSRNGPWDVAVAAWNAMSSDVHQRFAIDDQRVYATGFSGGARVAIRVAVACKCVAGVIASGAGFPLGISPSSSLGFLFLGAVGFDDFNFPEMLSLDESLTKARVIHRMETFAGRHEWLPAPVATAAVEWMELQAMKIGKRKIDETLVNAIWQQEVTRANALENAKQLTDAQRLYQSMLQDFRELRNIDEVARKSSELSSGSEFKAAIRQEQDETRKQRHLEKQLRAMFAERDRVTLQEFRESSSLSDVGNNQTSRINDELGTSNQLEPLLKKLRASSKATEDSSQRRVARRTLGGLFAGFFERGLNHLLGEKRYGVALTYLKIAIELNPDHPGALFYLSWAHAANGDKKRSLRALTAAVEKGFSDVASITDNNVFELLRNDPQFQQILASLRNK